MASMSEAAAFVIAGGQSSRMGRDKAFLELDGRTLLERALDLAHSVSDQVMIVGRRDKFGAYADVVEDVYPGQGPLAGIHAALLSSSAELNLMLGVDTPFLDARFVQYLIEQAEASKTTVTVPVTSKLPQINTDQHRSNMTHSDQCSSVKISGSASAQPQPLCAVYRREFAAVAEESLRQRRNNIVPLFAKVSVREIGDSELRQLAFDPIMFENLNTPEEWEQARRRLQVKS
ncbi:MAG: molybdenum cofactor guanylyltransferase [Acidobacteriia bacterium]|nr:molybdenum cofactor guanylyltransferase [Terriglobia bacterium]